MNDDAGGRQPRQGDRVVAAPFGENCISGEVVSLRARRVTIKTAEHGNLTVMVHRLTWKAKARLWVCWPIDMHKVIERLDRGDEACARARFGIRPEVGDVVVSRGRVGWISRLVSRPVKATRAPGVTFSVVGGYEITFGDGSTRTDLDTLVFDSDARLWRLLDV